MAERPSLVIVGGGQIAASLISLLAKTESAWQITPVSEEPDLPINRPLLSKDFLLGKVGADKLPIVAEDLYDKLGVTRLFGVRACAIDREARLLHLDQGEAIAYDKLVLATGARLRELTVPGVADAQLYYLKTRADAEALKAAMARGGHLTVIGGGFIGLEIAAAARSQGLAVTVLEAQSRLLARVMAPPVSAQFAKWHSDNGVEVCLEACVESIATASDGKHVVRLADGRELQTDTIVVGIGVMPNTELASDAGLYCENGIVVDAECRSSDPAIYAAGDCASRVHPLYGQALRLESIDNATHQAALIVASLTAGVAPKAQVPWFWSTQGDKRLQIAGLSMGYDTVIERRKKADSVSWLYLRDGQLIACDAVNNPADFMQAKKLIGQQAMPNPELLADSGRKLSDCLTEH